MSEHPLQEIAWAGRPLTVRWLPPPFAPPPELVTQAYGICFTEHRKIVLVSTGGGYWNLPGGTLERGETPEQALGREVWEEACARVVRSQYIGCQLVEDPQAVDGPIAYYQTRFWARVEIYPFKPQFETVERKLVDPNELLATLAWGEAPNAKIILDCGITVENRNGGGCL
ncbi:MAG: NUDIX hydrolase [Kouleothrix sp.]|nr:NUDIX hydrolase [Kouleothrix sp.]